MGIVRIFSAAPLLATLLLAATASQAALDKYDVRYTILISSSQTSPTRFQNPAVQFAPDQPGVALVDDGPVLRRLVVRTDYPVTAAVPQLSGFIYVTRNWTEIPAPDHSGLSGDTSSQIAWGTITGWQATGVSWCNSEPATVCILAGQEDEATTAVSTPSPFYDLGTWFFHGTGFTSVPYVATRFTIGADGDNQQSALRGAFNPDGTVPTLPLLALGGLGVATVVAASLALRRNR